MGPGKASECVPVPTLISGLVSHAVRAMEAGPSLSAFEVDAVASGGQQTRDVAAPAEANMQSGRTVTRAIWLAGDVEAFNIPGTISQISGLHFLPSCYQWQHC